MSPQFSLEHIGLAAQDTTALKDWYERMLGARVIYQGAQMPIAYFIELPGGTWIEIYQGSYGANETADNHLQGWRHVALAVESIDAAKLELEHKGVRFTEAVKPAGGGGRVLFFQDCEGNLLHLVERTTDSVFRKSQA
jgi:glyoxylase I family protein